jgi:hypothetical protein
MKEVSKFIVNLFAAIGAVKVGSIGVGMIEENDGNFLMGVLITGVIVAYISVSTYLLSNKLSQDSDKMDLNS